MKLAPIGIDNDRIVAQIASGSGDHGEIFAQRRLPTSHEYRGRPRTHDFQHADGLVGVEHARIGEVGILRTAMIVAVGTAKVACPLCRPKHVHGPEIFTTRSSATPVRHVVSDNRRPTPHLPPSVSPPRRRWLESHTDACGKSLRVELEQLPVRMGLARSVQMEPSTDIAAGRPVTPPQSRDPRLRSGAAVPR